MESNHLKISCYSIPSYPIVRISSLMSHASPFWPMTLTNCSSDDFHQLNGSLFFKMVFSRGKNGKLCKQPPKKVFCFSYIFYLLFKWMLLLLDPMLAYFTVHLRYVYMYKFQYFQKKGGTFLPSSALSIVLVCNAYL